MNFTVNADVARHFNISAELNASLCLHNGRLTVTAGVCLCSAVVVDNDDEKKEKKPKLKDDRMNQPDGVSCYANVIRSICSVFFYFALYFDYSKWYF